MSQELVGSEIKLPLDTNQNDNGKRETQQMLRFFAGTALTLLCSRLIRRTMNNLKCMYNYIPHFTIAYNRFDT